MTGFFSIDQRENFSDDLMAFSLINENTVEKIIDSRITQHNQRFYKVRWKDSWLLEDQLKEHCYELMKRYWTTAISSSQLPCFGKTFTGPQAQHTAEDTVQTTDIIPELVFSEEHQSSSQLLSIAIDATRSKPVSHHISHENNAQHQIVQNQGLDAPFMFQNVESLDTNVNESTIHRLEDTTPDRLPIETTPDLAVSSFTNTKIYSKVCLDCNQNFETKCQHCLGCRKCRNKKRCHFYECHGDSVCAICEHCFEGDECKICCPYCGQVYPTGGHWRRHIRVTHLGLDKPKSKRSTLLVADHDIDNSFDEPKANASTPRKHKCSTCEKLFANPHKLRRHEKIHSNVREYRCHVCEKEFVQKIHLTKHLLQHGIGDKRFKCHNCDKWFNHKISLKTHVPKCLGQIR